MVYMKDSYLLTFYRSEYIQYNVILDNAEIRKKVADFLLKYVSLEAFYKKMLIAQKEKNGKKLTPKEKRNQKVDASEVKKILDAYLITVDHDLIDRIFGSNNKNYMECSVKNLRNRLVHNVNENVIRVVLERYDKINEDLDTFAALL